MVGKGGATKKATKKTADSKIKKTMCNGLIHECLSSVELLERGLGSVWVSRKIANGKIALAIFLVDTYCLGVKDTLFIKSMTLAEYKSMLFLSSQDPLTKREPCCAKKLLVEAVAYARDLGFSPQGAFEEAFSLVEPIYASDCDAQFEFGRDGKPYYVVGPNDTPEQSDKIINTLRQRCGDNGFDMLMDPFDLDDDEEEDEDGFFMGIDDPDEVYDLIETLEKSLPMVATFEKNGWKTLIQRGVVSKGQNNSVIIQKVFYGGDEGGLLCQLAQNNIVCSLTHLRFDPKNSLAGKIMAYQKKRVKRLKEQKMIA